MMCILFLEPTGRPQTLPPGVTLPGGYEETNTPPIFWRTETPTPVYDFTPTAEITEFPTTTFFTPTPVQPEEKSTPFIETPGTTSPIELQMITTTMKPNLDCLYDVKPMQLSAPKFFTDAVVQKASNSSIVFTFDKPKVVSAISILTLQQIPVSITATDIFGYEQEMVGLDIWCFR